jgi:type IV pilus assembly protein PilY1
VQSVYAIKDPLTGPAPADLRSNLSQLQISTDPNGQRTVTCVNANACNSPNGWFVDFPASGERVNIDITLQLGTLFVLSNIPSNEVCSAGGSSFLNFFDFRNGQAPLGPGTMSGIFLGNTAAAGYGILQPTNGGPVVNTNQSDGGVPKTNKAPIAPTLAVGKRVTWREIIK